MSRIAFTIGIVASVIVHGILLLGGQPAPQVATAEDAGLEVELVPIVAVATLIEEPEHTYQDGTSELKTWIALNGCLSANGSDLTPAVIDYVPCYRSLAGSGTAQGFMVWN